MFAKESPKYCSACSAMGWLVTLLLLLATVASFVGVYKAHVLVTGATFGTTNGSLAILAFVVSLTLLAKMAHGCCGCGMKK